MAKTRLPPKKDVVMALLEKSSVYMHLDPRSDSVMVPPWFKHQPQLVLQVGLNMPVPITDLNVDDTGVSCTLSFNRSPQFCRVPWNAIYALVGEDGRGMVWPDDVPPEVASETRPPGEARSKAKGKGHLRAVNPNERERAKAAAAKRSKRQAASQPARRPKSNERKARSHESPTTKAPTEDAPVSSEKGAASKRKLPPYLRIVK